MNKDNIKETTMYIKELEKEVQSLKDGRSLENRSRNNKCRTHSTGFRECQQCLLVDDSHIYLC